MDSIIQMKNSWLPRAVSQSSGSPVFVFLVTEIKGIKKGVSVPKIFTEGNAEKKNLFAKDGIKSNVSRWMRRLRKSTSVQQNTIQ